METMTAFDAAADRPVSPPPRRPPRRLHATTIVTALYVALVLGAPAIVRFAPDAGAPQVAHVTAQATHSPCASAAACPSGCTVLRVAEQGTAAQVH